MGIIMYLAQKLLISPQKGLALETRTTFFATNWLRVALNFSSEFAQEKSDRRKRLTK